MIGRSRPQSRGRAQSTAIAVVSLVMLIAASVSNAYAQTNSPTAAWIQAGKGTGPAKVSVRAASASGATVTIEIPGVQTEPVDINGAQYTKLTIPGAVSTGFGVGKAEVPSIPVLLARPTGSAVTFSILSIQTETLHVARVFPMQPPLKSGEQASPLVIDNSFYASDVDYPSSRLSSPSLATWRDLDVVNVHVYPVVVRPAQHEVIVTSRITFRASFSGGRYPTKVTGWMRPMYQRLIRNYDDLRFTTTSIDTPGTKCLMFCNNAYADDSTLNDLRHTMTVLGDSTELVRVGGSGGMDNDPYAIKDTIIARYVQQDSVLRWVWLIGECGQIRPREHFRIGEPPDTHYVRYSDYWYTDLDERALLLPGGGYEDSCDNYPEVGIARLSPGVPDSSQDLINQVVKIKDYMTGRDAGPWLNTITLVADGNAPYPEGVRAVRDTPLPYYSYRRDTIMGCDSAFTNGDIRNAVNITGTGVLMYFGHGDIARWDTWTIDQSSWTKVECPRLDGHSEAWV